MQVVVRPWGSSGMYIFYSFGILYVIKFSTKNWQINKKCVVYKIYFTLYYFTIEKYVNINLLINREREQLLATAKQLWYDSELVKLLADPKIPLNTDTEWRINLNHELAKELRKKQWNKETTSEAKQSTETQTDTFCGMAVDQLTAVQKKLFDKLNPQQREELSQKIAINKQEWQIEFTQIKKAIKDTDIASNVTKSSADDAINKLWNGWELPKDIDCTDSNRLTLDPAQSDYDAMILQMPGANNNEKVENFRLLTGMSWWYRTSQNCKSKFGFVIRGFYEDGRGLYEDGRDWTRVMHDALVHVRPVRSL